MISDVLSDAIDEIREYQQSLPSVYGDPKLAAWIESVVASMEELRAFLDNPPAPLNPSSTDSTQE